MADNTQPAPSTQATYSDSDLAPLQDLIDTAKHRSGWDRVVGGITNLTIDAARYMTGTSGLWDVNVGKDTSLDPTKNSMSNTDDSFVNLLQYNKAAFNDGGEQLAENITAKLQNSGLLELAEMAGRNSSICQR
jgi:hypothetical protein